ncbi:hypothetical protein HMPREF9056_00088 [Actinomyces sp. oral taxon 170 str. F0386]|nr:hypothetical protein HMPREF9056_00088 [Actinomyces sp. oral taxon 170 str. F0386]
MSFVSGQAPPCRSGGVLSALSGACLSGGAKTHRGRSCCR